MKKLILVMNGKGGVGKSTFAINFVQFYKDHGLPHAAVDTDNENSTLKRFHPDAVFLEINKPRGLDGLFDLVEANPVVIGLPRSLHRFHPELPDRRGWIFRTFVAGGVACGRVTSHP